MFWTKVEKERLKRAYRARMSQAISGLEAMDISGLSQVYCAVATEDREDGWQIVPNTFEWWIKDYVLIEKIEEEEKDN